MDQEDYDTYCKDRSWYLTKRPCATLAPTRQAVIKKNGQRKRFYLARVILGSPDSQFMVTFKDGNHYNLRKENLELKKRTGVRRNTAVPYVPGNGQGNIKMSKKTYEIEREAVFPVAYYENAQRIAMALGQAGRYVQIEKEGSTYLVVIYKAV